jgi:PAS domain S-box-containing protein
LSGYALEEIRGRTPGSFLQGVSPDATVRQRMRAAIAAAEPFDEELSNHARDGRQYFVRIAARVTHNDRGEPTGFVAVQTDVTEQHVARRRESLAQKVAATLLDARSVADAAGGVVRALVHELEVTAANLWVVEPGRPTLRYVAGAGAPGRAGVIDPFLDASAALAFARGSAAVPGVGLPGLVWGTRQSSRVTDFAHSTGALGSRRLDAAAVAGVDLLHAAPILTSEGVVGVIEVANARGNPINEQLASILDHISHQLGAFVLHDRSRRAFQSVFDHSPDALLLLDESGRVDAANARAESLFGAVVGREVGALLDAGADLVEAALGEGSSASLQNRQAHGRDQQGFSAEVSAAVSHEDGVARVILAVRDLTERHLMEAELTRSLHEKETLLKEIHHRVKNNLQIISSLLVLQVDQMPSPEAKALLVESAARVRSMALVHQHLYGVESIARIDLANYVTDLAESLRRGLAAACVLELDIEPIEVTVEHAVPLGLILNELLTNALKYGASADGTHSVSLSLKRTDGQLTVRVADRGRGLPEGFDPARSRSLGLQLVRSLARQLRGKLTFRTEGGAVFELVCALPG